MANLRESAELVGIAAIVASLIFVGLQLKQSHEIAIAAQYHERTALLVDYYNVQLESGDLRVWASLTGIDATPDISAEELGGAYLTVTGLLKIFDNTHYQIQAGFVDDEYLQIQRSGLKALFSSGPIPVSILRNSSNRYRESFVAFCNEIIEEIEAESNKR